ncbi:hypothetical protein CRG98_022545 [Punica granatum]|nr:hypothetical protein CRG98_022545 [Punica granatum]
MAPGTEVSPQVRLGEEQGKGSRSSSPMEDEDGDTIENLNQSKGGKPPLNLSVMRHCNSSALLVELDQDAGMTKSPPNEMSSFLPVFRSGSCSDKGPKQYMEDEYICVDNLHDHIGTNADLPTPGAFYGVFDGHGGVDAASFTKRNILKYIVEDAYFPTGMRKAMKSAFVKADHAFADTSCLDSSSGTTALIALILGR